MVHMKAILLGAAMAAVAVTTIIALILALANRQTLDQPYSTQFGIVFDAGSSHTALFLYQWQGNKENNTGIVSQKQSCDVDGDGISSYVQNPAGAGESLKKCLDIAKAAIPTEQQKSTPVYLGATAGMRLLNLQNQTQSDSILAEVAKTIQTYPFDFRGARILTGMEEGAYGWITTNYLLESFIKHTFEGSWIHPKAGKIIGALDLGGASTQISFTPKDPVRDPNSAFNLQLYGYKYELYTYSYLCYGKDQALKKLQAYLHKNAGSSSSISHPCYHKGYNLNLTLAELYNSPCVVPPSSFNPKDTILFKGTGNSSLCLSLIENIVNLTGCALSPDCGFNGIYQPPVNGEFFAFSAYFYTFDFLGLTPKAPLTKVLSTIDTLCSKNWTALTAENPSIKPKYLKDYCASGHYITTILLKGYKFNNTWDQISFVKQVADTDIGWTLGYMLNLTNMIPSERSSAVTGVPHSQWAAEIFFIAFALFLTLLIIVILSVRDITK
ncbi:ectonucleoside triphosphate diphosphohydrolase 8 isoform X1 [Danio rerio]|uniref:Ectonucleoside triphosphate diphosphohydrolase 8 n=6 Tax=Danio rerio TaxID=7955 RepID=F1QCU4_DANRE|nr:ectonucleoside triphosphate diphosphohydrolase 8 [Danio rerio]|eukprot:NP_001002379.2 ectonucleoside triphosphate diphosphohydrolase 8 [Danio rerio]